MSQITSPQITNSKNQVGSNRALKEFQESASEQKRNEQHDCACIILQDQTNAGVRLHSSGPSSTGSKTTIFTAAKQSEQSQKFLNNTRKDTGTHQIRLCREQIDIFHQKQIKWNILTPTASQKMRYTVHPARTSAAHMSCIFPTLSQIMG